MKIPWSQLEGQYFRIDVGTTKASAMSSSSPSTLYVTTDGYIVINGEEVANAQYTSSEKQRVYNSVQKNGDTLTGKFKFSGAYSYFDTTSQAEFLFCGPDKPNVLITQGSTDIGSRITFRNDGNNFFMIFTKPDGGFGERPFYIGLKDKLVHATGHFTQAGTSDLRSKTNLKDDFSALDVIERLGPVYEFDYNEKAGEDAGLHSFGLIAQNVEQVPEMSNTVGTKYDGIKYVNYIDPKFIALLLKAVKELESKIQNINYGKLVYSI